MGRYAVFGAILPRRHAAGTQAGTQFSEQYAEERANGWSPEDLAAYRRERERAAAPVSAAASAHSLETSPPAKPAITSGMQAMREIDRNPL